MYSKERLLEMLSSDNATVRYDACVALQFSQESSPEIINALVNATQDKESSVAAKAKIALQADIHHQLAIKMGIVEPNKKEVEPTELEHSTKVVDSGYEAKEGIPENSMAGTVYPSEKDIFTKPDSAEAYYIRGRAYVNKGDLDSAIRNWDQAIQLNPNYAEAYLNCGVAYNNKGETANAIAYFKKVLELCGTDTQVCQAAQQRLEKLGVK